MKPIVYYSGEPIFDTAFFGVEVAIVQTINHPKLGNEIVRTSKVVKKYKNGNFDTLNILYRKEKTA